MNGPLQATNEDKIVGCKSEKGVDKAEKNTVGEEFVGVLPVKAPPFTSVTPVNFLTVKIRFRI